MFTKEGLLDQVRRETSNPLILNAFCEVDRKLFTPRGQKRLAYQNEAIPLNHGAALSQPVIVAQMMESLGLTGKEKVLEIGTASGFGAALLSRCASWVYTIELNRHLARSAQRRLDQLGFENITVINGDGALGLPQFASFDAIMVTAGARDIPEDLETQLAENGRIIIPYGNDINHLDLVLGIKQDGYLTRLVLDSCRFVPLMSPNSAGWTEQSLKKTGRLQSLTRIV